MELSLECLGVESFHEAPETGEDVFLDPDVRYQRITRSSHVECFLLTVNSGI